MTPLRPGDRVRLLAAAGETAALLAERGLAVETGGDSVEELADALADPGVRAVITGHGDDGHRVVERLDPDAVRRHPKLLVGTGGVTHVHMTLWRTCGLPGAYGHAEPGDALHRALTSTEPTIIKRHPADLTAAVSAPGCATGVLLGGTLSQLRGLIGVGMPSLDGAILLLDDKRTVGLGQVDRQLTHLRRSGALDGIRGVAIGRFTGFEGYTDRGWTLVEVLTDRLTDLGVPVLGGLRSGDGPVPIGAAAVLDADAGTLVVEPAVS